MYYVMSHNHNPLMLPAMMAVSLLSFYGIIWVTESSLDQARASGWVMPLSEQGILLFIAPTCMNHTSFVSL